MPIHEPFLCAPPVGMDREHGAGAMEDPAVKAVAAELGVTPAQAVLKWGLQRGTSVVPKSADPGRLAENLAAALDVDGAARLSPQQAAALDALDRGCRYNDPGVFCRGMGGLSPIYD